MNVGGVDDEDYDRYMHLHIPLCRPDEKCAHTVIVGLCPMSMRDDAVLRTMPLLIADRSILGQLMLNRHCSQSD